MPEDNQTTEYSFLVLGEALAPVAEKMRNRMHAEVHGVKPTPDAVQLVRDHMQILVQAAQRLEKEANGLEQACSQGAAAIHHGAGRLDAHMEQLLDHYDELREIDPGAYDGNILELLSEIWRHLLTEVQEWLDDVTEFCADPVTWLKKREMPTSGNVEVTFALKLTPTPEIKELVDWLKQKMLEDQIRRQPGWRAPRQTIQAKRSRQVDTNRRERKMEQPEASMQEDEYQPGFFDHVLAVCLGVGLADLLFFDDD